MISLNPWRLSPDPEFGMVEPDALVRTTWWRRFGATVIDIAASWLVASIAGVLGGPFATIAWMCFVAWNNIYQTAVFGSSLGRHAMGYRILDDQLFDPIGPGRAIGRFFVSALDAALIGLGYLLPLFNQERQRAADMIVRSAPFDVDGLTTQGRQGRTMVALAVGVIAAFAVPSFISGGYDGLDRASEISAASTAASAASLKSAAYLADPAAVGLPVGVQLTDVTVWQRWTADAPAHQTMTKDLRVTFFSAAFASHPGWSGKPAEFAPLRLPEVSHIEFRVGSGVACLHLIAGTDAAGLLNNQVVQQACKPASSS